MTTARPTFAQVLATAVESRLAEVHTALPAKVVSYDATAQTIEAKPLVKRVYTDSDGVEQVESLPVLTGIPVAFPRAGGFFLSFPIAAGDQVLLVFAERSLDTWLASGRESDPGDIRKHSLSDAIAIPGVYSSQDALQDAHASNLTLGKDGGVSVHLTPSGDVLLGSGSASELVALASKVLTELSAIVTGYNTHVHTSAAPGNPTSVPATPLTSPGSVAATKVKAI